MITTASYHYSYKVLTTHLGGVKTDEQEYICTLNSTHPSQVSRAHLWEEDWKPGVMTDDGKIVRMVQANNKLYI